MSVWNQTGIKPKELDNLIELPEEHYEIWGWFATLNESRSSNGYGLNPITYSDILAFFTLIQIQPHEWEVHLIKRLDREVLGVYAKKAEIESKKK